MKFFKRGERSESPTYTRALPYWEVDDDLRAMADRATDHIAAMVDLLPATQAALRNAVLVELATLNHRWRKREQELLDYNNEQVERRRRAEDSLRTFMGGS